VIDRGRIAALAAVCRGALPDFALGFDGPGPPLSLGEALSVVADGLRECMTMLRDGGCPAAPALFDLVPSFDPSRAPVFRRRGALDALAASLAGRPASVRAVLLQGSLADGGIVEGFSDADVVCVASLPRDPGDLLEMSLWLTRLNGHLVALNPCAHHGPSLVFEEELDACAEADLPSAVVRNGRWLAGRIDRIAYRESNLENLLALSIFEPFFERWITGRDRIGSAFEALWFVSSALILPILVHQAETR
jgi:hypothetical protein